MPGLVERYIQEQQARSREIESLRSAREETLNDLGRLYLHAREAGAKEYKRFAELPEIDRRIERIDRERPAVPREAQDLANRVDSYARAYSEQAEGQIGMRLAQGIRDGAASIDLSQRYETDNPAQAEHRHSWALTNLSPFIHEAERLGYKVERGEAIPAQQQKIGFEETQGFSQGVG